MCVWWTNDFSIELISSASVDVKKILLSVSIFIATEVICKEWSSKKDKVILEKKRKVF